MRRIEASKRLLDIEQRWRTPIGVLFHKWHWQENLKHSEIGERLGMPRPTVTRWFRQLGVPTQSCTRFTNLNLEKHREQLRKNKKPKPPKKEFPWHFNKKFFESWSDEMAYVLGFLIADGHIVRNPRGSNYFGFTSTDREIIEKVRAILQSNHKIGVRKRDRKNPLWSTQYVLQIGSKKVVEQLGKFGVIQNKSLIIDFPKDIPSEYLRHFVRGYFDGDGGVYLKQHWRKDRNKFYWVFQTCFVSGSRRFLEGLHNALKGYTKGGFISQKNRGYALVFSHRDGLALRKMMYHNVSTEMFLERKHKVFQQAIQIMRA